MGATKIRLKVREFLKLEEGPDKGLTVFIGSLKENVFSNDPYKSKLVEMMRGEFFFEDEEEDLWKIVKVEPASGLIGDGLLKDAFAIKGKKY